MAVLTYVYVHNWMAVDPQNSLLVNNLASYLIFLLSLLSVARHEVDSYQAYYRIIHDYFHASLECCNYS